MSKVHPAERQAQAVKERRRRQAMLKASLYAFLAGRSEREVLSDDLEGDLERFRLLRRLRREYPGIAKEELSRFMERGTYPCC